MILATKPESILGLIEDIENRNLEVEVLNASTYGIANGHEILIEDLRNTYLDRRIHILFVCDSQIGKTLDAWANSGNAIPSEVQSF